MNTEENKCGLSVVMFRFGVKTSISYDAKTGLKGRLVVSGWIDDHFYDSHFHNKPVLVEISSPPKTGWSRELLGVTDDDKNCGLVQINADIEPERFEFDGEVDETEEPVKVMLEVSTDVFEMFRHQVTEAYERRLIMSAHVNFIVPQKDSSGGILLKDLDVSEPRNYAVSGFKLSHNTSYTSHLCGRVRPLAPEWDEEYGTMISILLVEARDEVSLERGIAHRISCDGRIVNARGVPYDGTDVTIDFYEHETNRFTGELPERAFFGEFGFWPKQTDEEYSSYHFSLDLKHNPEDISKLLLPILTYDVHTQVFLDVYLIIEKKDLIEATDELRGNVRYYKFNMRRALINKA